MKVIFASFAIVAGLASVQIANADNAAQALMNSAHTNAWSTPQWGMAIQGPPTATEATKNRLAPTARPPLKFKQPYGLNTRVLVIDEESLLAGDPKPLAGAEVHWLSEKSGLVRTSREDGYSPAPYPHTISARFVVTMPGYLPAVGYATAGTTTPVILIAESRVGPVLKSLGVVPDSDRVLVVGKILQANLKPANHVTLDASIDLPFRVFYSLGSFGLFHPAARETGAQGDFLISGLNHGIQYLMPTSADREWPSWTLDTTGLPAFVTTTLVDSAPTTIQTQVVDAFSLDRPDSGVNATIGGQRGLYQSDEEGLLKLPDLHPRGSMDLLEVQSPGYFKTWVNTVANAKVFPSNISLFTSRQLGRVMEGAGGVDFTHGFVFGNLNPENFSGPVSIQIFNSAGKRNREARVYYFNADNRIEAELTQTDGVVQNFAISQLDTGEWHLLVVDPATGSGLGVQAVRVEEGTITQVQF